MSFRGSSASPALFGCEVFNIVLLRNRTIIGRCCLSTPVESLLLFYGLAMKAVSVSPCLAIMPSKIQNSGISLLTT